MTVVLLGWFPGFTRYTLSGTLGQTKCDACKDNAGRFVFFYYILLYCITAFSFLVVCIIFLFTVRSSVT